MAMNETDVVRLMGRGYVLRVSERTGQCYVHKLTGMHHSRYGVGKDVVRQLKEKGLVQARVTVSDGGGRSRFYVLKQGE